MRSDLVSFGVADPPRKKLVPVVDRLRERSWIDDAIGPTGNMRVNARVRPLVRCCGQSGVDRVVQDVFDRVQEMNTFHGRGPESTLPEAAEPLLSAIDGLRVALMSSTHRLG